MRGKAKVGDKTLLDVIVRVGCARGGARGGEPLAAAGAPMLAAASQGRDRVTPLRNKIGRASWLGGRTEGRSIPAGISMVALTAIIGG